MYKVLWFDDECTTLEDIVEDCLLNDIQLVGFSNAKEGLKTLNKDHYRFDAILLDGMFFNDAKQKGDPDESAFGEVAIALGQLEAKGIVLPWFIYSGQKNFVKEKISWLNYYQKRHMPMEKSLIKITMKILLSSAKKLKLLLTLSR
jgi:hypothetical protein